MIQVRSRIELGMGEGGPWLSGKRCNNRIEVKGETFPNLNALQDPQDRRFSLHAVDFSWDETAINEFLLIQHKVNRKTEHIRGTVIGVFETRTPLNDLIREDRPYPLNGFGDQGASPAQILVKTMTDMAIEKNPK